MTKKDENELIQAPFAMIDSTLIPDGMFVSLMRGESRDYSKKFKVQWNNRIIEIFRSVVLDVTDLNLTLALFHLAKMQNDTFVYGDTNVHFSRVKATFGDLFKLMHLSRTGQNKNTIIECLKRLSLIVYFDEGVVFGGNAHTGGGGGKERQMLQYEFLDDGIEIHLNHVLTDALFATGDLAQSYKHIDLDHYFSLKPLARLIYVRFCILVWKPQQEGEKHYNEIKFDTLMLKLHNDMERFKNAKKSAAQIRKEQIRNAKRKERILDAIAEINNLNGWNVKTTETKIKVSRIHP